MDLATSLRVRPRGSVSRVALGYGRTLGSYLSGKVRDERVSEVVASPAMFWVVGICGGCLSSEARVER